MDIPTADDGNAGVVNDCDVVGISVSRVTSRCDFPGGKEKHRISIPYGPCRPRSCVKNTIEALIGKLLIQT